MNIYAVRDRLLDYYLHPFAAHTDKEVLGAIATAINREGNLDAIAQAPHHFEIWKIGEVDDDGHLTARKELLATCENLIRPRQSAEIARAIPEPPEYLRRAGNAPESPAGPSAQGAAVLGAEKQPNGEGIPVGNA